MIKKKNLTLVLGGARSGKSRRAQLLCEALSDARVFIATAEPFDNEMAERIAQHRLDRGSSWQTVEAPLDIVEAIRGASSSSAVCLVDCLTLWLSNLMHTDRDVDTEISKLLGFLENATGAVVFVSNEVGMGLVPETPLGREFRDLQGRLNQRVASICDYVEFVAAGLPITLKG